MQTKAKHLAFIMDGNRRWATERGLPKMKGHTEGLDNFQRIIKACSEHEVPYVTFWALSTENLKKRSEKELTHLFKLLGQIRDHLKEFVQHDARVEYIGDLSKLPAGLRSILRDVAKKTENHNRMVITLAINYGGKDEITRMAKQVASTARSSSQVSEKVINSLMDTGDLPPVDMIIRTGGHRRLSGFLPWIADYAELYFTDKKWPEFTKEDLNTALEWFDNQERNFGK